MPGSDRLAERRREVSTCTGAREQNRTADLFITRSFALNAVLTRRNPMIQDQLNDRCATSYLLCPNTVQASDGAVSHPPAILQYMDKKIWTAAELEKMTPAERHELSKASVVRDLNDAPQHLVEKARQFVEARVAAEETSTAS